MTGDEHDVGVRLGDTGGNGAHADLGDEFHANASLAIGVLEVVNQLREILNRVDVVVRWWRDEADAGRGEAGLRDPRIDFGAGKLAAFAGLGALSHLDLEFAGIDEVLARDAEAAGGDLLDGGVEGIAVGLRLITGGIFAALAGIAFAIDAIHRDGERLVRLLANGAIGHRAGLEPLHDTLGWLHLIDRDRVAGLEL